MDRDEIGALCDRLEEAAVCSDFSAEHANVLVAHFRPQLDALRDEKGNLKDAAAAEHARRIAPWALDSARDARRWTKEAADFRLAAALIRERIL